MKLPDQPPPESVLKGFRRVFVVSLAMVLSFVALGLEWITSSDFNNLWNWLLTAYLASDAAEKGASAWKVVGSVEKSAAGETTGSSEERSSGGAGPQQPRG